MGLIFTMLRNDDQTLKNTTEMEDEVSDEPSVNRSEGKTGEEHMGDRGFAAPVSYEGPFQEFYAVWLAAHIATNETYEMPTAIKDDRCDTEKEQTDSDGSSVTRLDELALTKLRDDAKNGSPCTFGRPSTATTREYSCNLSAADRLLLVRRTLELERIAEGGDLPYYPDEPPATGWASSVTSEKMTRLERASERQKMNSGKESASHVTRNRLVQRFPTHSSHPIRK